jgi:peptidoglycan/LPS O-acetylase OafA/YrhL
MNPSNQTNLDIQVLRAVAVLMVLIDHCEMLISWNGSIVRYVHIVTSLWGGVDMFFAISGFVITGLLLRSAKEAEFVKFAAAFWMRRIFRIWPSAVLWILAVLVASLIANASGAFGKPDGDFFDLIAVLIQMANLHWYHCNVVGLGNCGINTVYWSLSLEEQFYFVFPFLFFFLTRKKLQTVLAIVIAILFFLPRPPNSFLWEIRVDALAWGAIIALCLDGVAHRILEPRFLAKKGLGILTILILAGIIASLGTNQVVWFQVGPIAFLSAIAVWIASYNKGYVCHPGYLRTCLLWVGSRSYAIYLIHPFAFRVIREIFFRLYPGQEFNDHFLLRFVVLGVALTFALAEINFRLVETPLRRKGKRIASRLTMSPNSALQPIP